MIRLLRSEDAEFYFELRRAALLDSPLSFTSSPEDDLASTPDAVRRLLGEAPASVVLGAFHPDLVGGVGIYRERHAKSSHKARLWGMYVDPGHRRKGMGTALLQSALEHARSIPGVDWIHLSVSSAAPGAMELYERAGFRAWGTEPDALRHGGRSADEHHMALCLKGPEAP